EICFILKCSTMNQYSGETSDAYFIHGMILFNKVVMQCLDEGCDRTFVRNTVTKTMYCASKMTNVRKGELPIECLLIGANHLLEHRKNI
ncbi:MAG: hypothetical protein ACTSUE_02295, partial [Promethearchaeota archaeon]